MYSGNPVDDFLAHDQEQEAWLRKRPKCQICGDHIQEESAHYIDGFGWICDSCLRDSRKDIDD